MKQPKQELEKLHEKHEKHRTEMLEESIADLTPFIRNRGGINEVTRIPDAEWNAAEAKDAE